MQTLTFSLLALLLSPLTAGAGEHSHGHDDEGFIEHHAHEHGHVQTNISNFENTTRLEFIFPSKDIFGFEHDPHDEEQRTTVRTQLEVLQDVDCIFVINPSCKLLDTHLESELAEGVFDHKTHDEAHDDHADRHHEKEHEDERHSDITASYELECNTKKDIVITFNLFKSFPSIEELQVRYVSAKEQATATITPDHTSFTFP